MRFLELIDYILLEKQWLKVLKLEGAIFPALNATKINTKINILILLKETTIPFSRFSVP